ncbi:hypothetical protein H4582DRAFT_2073464 [Lactarius indigo]|nr:hypothetical protein H4582DRAFT_2073464 [Lactarius indigo]
MADLFNPADPFLDLRRVDTDPLPPPSVNGIPSADSDDEGPHGSEECGTLAAPNFPAVGRQDDEHESQKYSAPVRSRMNWLSSAALMTARTAARVVASALTDPRYPPGPRQSYPGNYYNPATSASHASCPLCGTPYQGSSSRWGPSYAPMIGYEQAQSGHHPCPACHCPTSIRPSSTGAPTRFLSSGRGEYITGHPSPSQHLGVTTNYARPQAAFSGNVASSMSTPDPGYQASPTDSSISGRSFGVTHTETRNDVPGMYGRNNILRWLTEHGHLATTQISPPLQ